DSMNILRCLNWALRGGSPMKPEMDFVLTLPPAAPAREPSPSRRTNKALWLIGAGLLANAAVLLFARGGPPDIVLSGSAFAQSPAGPGNGQLLGARGIYMTPAQLAPNAWGFYLMDVDSGTVCVYRIVPETSHLRLMA